MILGCTNSHPNYIYWYVYATWNLIYDISYAVLLHHVAVWLLLSQVTLSFLRESKISVFEKKKRKRISKYPKKEG